MKIDNLVSKFRLPAFKNLDPVLVREVAGLMLRNQLLKAKILFLECLHLKDVLHIRLLEFRNDVVAGFHFLFPL